MPSSKKHGTEKAAEAYLRFLYTPEGPGDRREELFPAALAEVAARYAAAFPKLALFTIDDPLFGGWHKVQETHFADGAIFDQIYRP